MHLITIFTPTYNRADALNIAYDSLVRQKNKDFLWLIVDDGSTDNTEEIVSKWISEGKIDIKYIKTKNQGKPSATNLSIDLCDSYLWTCLDSDDYLSDNAIDVISKCYSVIKNNSECCGIVGNKFYFDGSLVGKNRLQADKYLKYRELAYPYGFHDNKFDRIYIYKTEVLKSYRYPIISGEKFIGESYLHEQLDLLYLMYTTNEKLYNCEYRKDGLTSNYLRLHVKSPKSYKLLKLITMTYPKPLWHRFRGAIMYGTGCILCGDKNIIRNSPKPFMMFFAMPFSRLAYAVKYRRIVAEYKNARN